METPKTFKELFKGTGIEPTTDENGIVHYNFTATLKKEPIVFSEEEYREHVGYLIKQAYAEGHARYKKCSEWELEAKAETYADDVLNGTPVQVYFNNPNNKDY